MGKKTDGEKKSQREYMAKFHRIQLRVTPEEHKRIQDHADAHGESVNGFVTRAVRETIEREKKE